ncbi:hypothetical protein [Sphingopyxis yananensis]|uniref:hypothetical protein n=1 Tax=Sphingopyxis yananensis TaxID=2886687 RepID=UPI001D12E653|nr:hypothetical protein [Sphingopyxis yananensis]
MYKTKMSVPMAGPDWHPLALWLSNRPPALPVPPPATKGDKARPPTAPITKFGKMSGKRPKS